MAEPNEELIRSMICTAMDKTNKLSSTSDYGLFFVLMRTALLEGYGPSHLTSFWGAGGIRCFGFFRDHTHYAGMCRIKVRSRDFVCGTMVQTTGTFDGAWLFRLDSSRPAGRSDTIAGVSGDFNGLKLVEALVRSSLTQELAVPSDKANSRARAKQTTATQIMLSAEHDD